MRPPGLPVNYFIAGADLEEPCVLCIIISTAQSASLLHNRAIVLLTKIVSALLGYHYRVVYLGSIDSGIPEPTKVILLSSGSVAGKQTRVSVLLVR